MSALNIAAAFKNFEVELPNAVVMCLRALLNAKAYVGTLKPISEEIQKEALILHPVVASDSEVARIEECVGKPITRFDDLYLASEEDANVLYRYHREKMVEKGFSAEPNCCPMLTAESMERESRRALFEVMESYTGISYESLYLVSQIKQYEELLLGLLVPLACEQGINLSLLPK